MPNDYFEAFEELRDKRTFKGQQWFGERQDLVEQYSWAVPEDNVLTYIAEFDDIIEIGAGNGYWASLIEERGSSVRAIDADPPEETYTEVEQAKAYEVFDELYDATVLMVWPPYGESMAARIARQEPAHILYVGEPRGGCTASDKFFDIVERQYGLVGKLGLPSYEGVHDDFFHYARKV